MAKPTDQLFAERKWHIFAALGSGIFLAAFDGGVVRVALPLLVTEFDVDFALVQWVVLSFSLTQTAIMLGVGRLGDMVGKKPVFLFGTIRVCHRFSPRRACSEHRVPCFSGCFRPSAGHLLPP